MPVPRFADNTDPRSLASRLRVRRTRLLLERMAPHAARRILDVGGSEQAWRSTSLEPKVTLVNLARSREDTGACRFVLGDGRHLPFVDKAFDLVVCNSVIEHVGDRAQQQRLADEIRRVGQRYWVQAPNRRFPLEPHFLFPGFQFLPVWLRVVVARHWPFSWLKHYHASPREIEAEARTIHLPDERELRRLFPEAVVHRECVLGLAKSLAVYTPAPLPL